MAISYCGTEDLKLVNTASDKNKRILILDVELNGTNFLLTNLYNSNTEYEQLSAFSTLQKTTSKIWWLQQQKNIAFGGDLNLIFDCEVDASGGNPTLKKYL